MAEEEEEGNAITYETFRKFHRREKNNEKLQDLPEDFFRSCVDWINAKEEEFEEKGDSSLVREIENVKNLVKDIFDRRRKKILLLALHSVRSKKVSENLLLEEEDFFEKTVENLEELEENLLQKVLGGEKPGEEVEEMEDKKEETEEEAEKGGEDTSNGSKGEIEEENNKEEVTTDKIEVDNEEGKKLVRTLEEVERFMGTDENEYGPLEEGDLVTLPEDVAELLVEKGRAEEADV